MMNLSIQKDLKGLVPIAYIRLSFDEIGDAKASSREDILKIAKIKLQIKRLKDFCKSIGLTLKDENIFVEVASGGDNNRPVQKQFVKKVISNKKNFGVVTDLSRWWRDMRYGIAGTIPFYEANNLFVSADDNLIIGTKKRPQPDADTLLGIKITLAGGERENLRRRTQSSMTALKEAGTFTSAGLELYPSADIDPYDYIIENMGDAAPKKFGGVGWQTFAERIGVLGGESAPSTESWAKTAVKRIQTLMSEMTDDQFTNWNAFRKYIREMERMNGADSWPMKAVRYRVNGYITQPLTESFSREPTVEEVQEYFSNPIDNLSFKLTKLYKSQVSKRRKK